MRERAKDPAALTILKARLALRERAPDETFVRRVALEVEAGSIATAAARERRGQLAIDISAAGALRLAARELGSIAAPAADLLLPIHDGIGTAAVLAALLMLLLAGFTVSREARV